MPPKKKGKPLKGQMQLTFMKPSKNQQQQQLKDPTIKEKRRKEKAVFAFVQTLIANLGLLEIYAQRYRTHKYMGL